VLEGMSKVHREVVKAAGRQPQGRFQRWSQRRELRKSVSRLEHGVAGFWARVDEVRRLVTDQRGCTAAARVG
jgi:hypothetical protein